MDQHMRQGVNDDDSQAANKHCIHFQPPPDELKKVFVKLVSSSSANSVATSFQPCPSLRDFCLFFLGAENTGPTLFHLHFIKVSE